MATTTELTPRAGTLPWFTYERLPDSRNHIRLLQVFKADDQQTVECRLSTWAIESVPPYYAISYTWGEPADTVFISMNNRRRQVRKNWEYVLRQASWHDMNCYYWVDALCIDQNHTGEKNEQVRMMGQIYAGAAEVLACVGPEADDSCFLFDMIRKHKYLCRHGFEPRGPPNSHWDSRLWIHTIRWFGTFGPDSRLRLRKAAVAFRARPYFSRVWVAQEIFLSKSTLVCCGREENPLRFCYGLMVLLNRERVFGVRPTRMADWSNSYTSQDGSSAPLQLETQVYATSDVTRYFGLGELLYFTLPLRCADPRDSVYGILSMVNWAGGEPILPDYDKSVFALALEVTWKIGWGTYPRHQSDPHPLKFTGQFLDNLHLTIHDLEAAHLLETRRDECELLHRGGTMDKSQTAYKTWYRWCPMRAWRILYDGIEGWKLNVHNVRATQETARKNRRATSRHSDGIDNSAIHEAGAARIVSSPMPIGFYADDDWSRPVARLCSNANPGDLMVSHHDWDIGLVVRDTSPEFYDVVGLATVTDLHKQEVDNLAHDIGVAFDAEDLILLALLQGECGRVKDGHDLDRLLLNRVCRSPGSSFVMRRELWKFRE
ncbi:hypothetical protein LTR37_007038 [Vermiconidia calcicola]|uniref:Uncharacterized protein n=1 Tax=Vermiconidia calcicola TaxID=1690605 RepID=A0ACC3NEK4_9PEZI|nr:hypothetical protein LTR37_007038 [Vermiconidia calcicola]